MAAVKSIPPFPSYGSYDHNSASRSSQSLWKRRSLGTQRNTSTTSSGDLDVLEQFSHLSLNDYRNSDEMLTRATTRLVSRFLFSSQRGMIGQWTIKTELPSDVLLRVYENMPVHSANGALLDLIPGTEVSLRATLDQVPQAVETEYFFLLDLQDRLWAQSVVLDSSLPKNVLFPQPTATAIAALVRQALQKVADGLLHFEIEFPQMWPTYRRLEKDRILFYTEDHPLRLIQPYLAPVQVRLPDYNSSTYAAYVRRFGA